MEIIKSTQNRHFKHIRSLEHKKYRDESGHFLIEGRRFAFDAPREQVISYACSESYALDGKAVPSEKLLIFSDELFSALSSPISPQGILAICSRKEYSLQDMLSENCLLLLLEEINDPGNLGTIIRSAVAAGADGIVISKGSADLTSPKTLRATASAVFSIPVITEADLPEAVKNLKTYGICCFASEPGAEKSLYELDLTRPSAFIVGNEAHGISPELSEACAEKLLIPMSEGVESLNAAIAAALMLYEAKRQRLYRK